MKQELRLKTRNVGETSKIFITSTYGKLTYQEIADELRIDVDMVAELVEEMIKEGRIKEEK